MRSSGLKKMAVPASAAITKKIAIAPAQISNLLRKMGKIGREKLKSYKVTTETPSALQAPILNF